MINVTDNAKDVLQDVRQDAMQRAGVHDEQTAVRLAQTSSSDGQPHFDLMLDQPKEGDQVVEHHGNNVLLVEPSISNQLDGVTLDAADTPQGRQLTIRRDA